MDNVPPTQICELEVTDVGGIERATASLQEGVNVLSGENATNRTSLLEALATVLGGDIASVHGGATDGQVEFTYDGTTYDRTVTSSGTTTTYSGNPYLQPDDARYAELYAFLFEDNPARTAVRYGDDLYDIIMEPVDTDEIDRRISNLKDEREIKREQLADLTEQLDRVPALRERRESLTADIEELAEELEDKRAEIEGVQGTPEESRELSQQIETKLNTLQSTKSELGDVDSKIETTEETIASLESRKEELQETLASVRVDEERLADVESEINTLYDRIEQKESMMTELQNVIQFNEEMLADDPVSDDIFAALRAGVDDETGGDGSSTSDPTDALVDDHRQQMVCWTCGSVTNDDEIAETVARIQSVHEDIYGERRQLQERLDELESERSQLQEQAAERESLTDEIEEIEEELARHRRNVEQLTDRRETLTAEIEELEAELDELREQHESRVLELHEEFSELDVEKQQLERELEEVSQEITTIENRRSQREEIEARIDEIESELEDLRTRVDAIERQAVEAFNEHMNEVLSVLEYDNIERLWIERTEVQEREGRRKVTTKAFEMHIVRETADGTTYDDTVDTLSESEREVVGLVFALAGYLVHDVHEMVPFMLLDSVEAIDSARLARLIEYFEDLVDNIVVALLPEDAAALPDRYYTIDSISQPAD